MKVKKVKAVPLQAWTDPDGSRNLRFPDFVTLYEGNKVKAVPYRPGQTQRVPGS